MITKLKLKEFEQFHGLYDGFYRQKVKRGTNLNSDDEWYLINQLIQKVELVKKGLTSDEFAEKLDKKLHKYCENEEAIEYLKKLAEEE